MLKIKKLRQEKNLSLRDLAQCLDIPYSSLGKYERGDQQPSLENIIKIADYFNVSTDYLLDNSIYKNDDEKFNFKYALTLPENKDLYDLFKKISSSYFHLQKLYSDCNLNPSSYTALPMQLLHNLRVMANIYSEISPSDINSIEDLGEHMGELTTEFTLNLQSLSLFREIIKLYNKSKEPPTTE